RLSTALVLGVALGLGLLQAPGALAQSPGASAEAAATDRSIAAIARLESQRRGWSKRKAEVGQRYREQLASIDELKRRRSSWARDRELREAYASSQATAKELAGIDRRMRGVDGQLVLARAELA